MKTLLYKNNFSAGQIDRDVKGRVDLPIFQNGFEISQNFCHTIKGDIFFRTGTRFLNEIGYAAFHEFKFSQAQSYLLVFRIQYIEFYSYNIDGELVQVLDDEGNSLQVTHPYGTEVFNLRTTQNSDVMYIFHCNSEYPEYQLKRTAANKFTLSKTTYTNSTKSLSNTSETDGHGYPAVGTFYENRLDRMSSSLYPTYLYGSKGADYDNITIGTNTNDGFQFDLAEAMSRASWMISGANSLLVGTPEGVITVNGGSVGAAITPSDISAKLSCKDGSANVPALRRDNFVFYVSSNGRKLLMFEYDTLMEDFKTTNLSKANYSITKGGMKKIIYKNDRHDFMYILCNGKLLCVCFSVDENVNAWSEIITDGEIVDFCTATRPNGVADLFLNVKRHINGKDVYYLEQLADEVEFSRFEDYISDIDDNINSAERLNVEKQDKYNFYRIIAEELRQCCYLDSSIEYSGLHKEKIVLDKETKTITSEDEIFTSADVNKRIWIKTKTGKEYGIFDIVEFVSATSVKVNIVLPPTNTTIDEWYLSATVFQGLEHLEGKNVAVVGNGGYIGDFVVTNGKIDISSANVNKVGNAIIGLKYKGVLKSPNLGLQYQDGQTFTSMKNITKIILQLSFSAGGEVGSSLYKLEKIQKFDTEGLLDVPPLPMDKDFFEVLLEDKYEKDKHFYIVQKEPLPFNINAIIPECNQVIRA
nr:MAG TPA: stabilization protein [Caudoviricetes sp.]